MVEPTGEQTAGIEFELLRTYPLSVTMAAAHPFCSAESITLEMLAAEPLIGLRRQDYPEYYHFLDRIFAPIRAKPRIAVECDSASSLIIEVEAGRGVALATGMKTVNEEDGVVWIERRRRFLFREFYPGERVGIYSIPYLSHLGHE